MAIVCDNVHGHIAEVEGPLLDDLGQAGLDVVYSVASWQVSECLDRELLRHVVACQSNVTLIGPGGPHVSGECDRLH